MKNVLKEIGLLIVALIIFPTVFIIGFIYTFIKHLWSLDYSLNRQLIPLIRSISLSLDGLANAGAGELINDFYQIKGKIKYGKWYQTISAISGLILLHEKDTSLRKTLDKALGTNHCVDAITEADKEFYNK